ncbi:hypothetical protein F5H01DRAFT_165671 [Linnemannia elongata]|nr:hypothetical protein F5H01DRAFT_165671 [Linnemannia elongata]
MYAAFSFVVMLPFSPTSSTSLPPAGSSTPKLRSPDLEPKLDCIRQPTSWNPNCSGSRSKHSSMPTHSQILSVTYRS